MRRHHFLGFAVAVATAAMLSLPLAAQDSQSTTAVQNQQSAATRPASNTATQKPPLAAPVKQGFWGRLNPFARKKYVQTQLSPIRDRVNELNGLSADNEKSINDVDANAKAGISAASDQAQQANQMADSAQQQVRQDSDQASQLQQQVGSVNTKVQGVDQYQVSQTAELHFKPGPTLLNSNTQQQLDTFLQGLDSQKGYVVEVTAYSSRKGAAGVESSQQLANTVVRYMVLQHNVPLYRIFTMGMGSAQAPAQAEMGSASGRNTAGGTVEIKILKNSLGN